MLELALVDVGHDAAAPLAREVLRIFDSITDAVSFEAKFIDFIQQY